MIKLLLSMKEELNVMFAAAPSWNDVLATLVSDPDIDWSRINAFHMDEYIGPSRTAPQGFGNFLRERVFGKAQFKSVNSINPEATDSPAEAGRYEALLLAHPMDVCILGIGENGHVAFNESGLLRAKAMFCIVPTANKAEAVNSAKGLQNRAASFCSLSEWE